MFQQCGSLQTVPRFNTAAMSTMFSIFNSCPNLISAPFTGTKISISYFSCKLSKSALEAIFYGLGTPATTQTITVFSNWGADTAITQSCNTTLGSSTVTVANSATLSTGMLVTGTGISGGVSVTFTASGSTVTLTNGLANGTMLSFSTITTTTGISVYTLYYVVNSSGSTFQLATSVGGSPITLTNDGSGTCLFSNYIQTINSPTSVTLNNPASITATGSTLSFRKLDTSIATLKRWTVSG